MTTEQEKVLALTEESQQLGDTFIRLSEYATSKPLSNYQREVLVEQRNRLKALGLKLIPDIKGNLYLHASHIVGITRFVHQRKTVTVQVEPRIAHADFIRMLDYTLTGIRVNQDEVRIGVELGDATGLLLRYFAESVLRFLQRGRYRNYTFVTNEKSRNVKGKPLIRSYVTSSLPRAEPHIIPCRYLNFTDDILENQIIAYAIHIAIKLTSLLTFRWQNETKEKLVLASRLLKGISVRCVTVSDIERIRYNRLNSHFYAIHKLCAVIIQSQTISLNPSERIPFMSFSTDMADLFETYITTTFKRAFGSNFISNKSKLRYPLDALGERIELDGLLIYDNKKYVIECKYKEIEQVPSDGEALEGRVKRSHLYQVVTYASHTDIRASGAILLYPIWGQAREGISVLSLRPLTAFGWHTDATNGCNIYVIGINLSSPFNQLIQEIFRVTEIIARQ